MRSCVDPAYKSAVLKTDGFFSHTPKPGFSGADSFTYTTKSA
ncbi:Ig-like domain-containing protein [Microvirga arsenatis]|uniref:Uncharacterized protein n=1 Tax=Microvirga arsenatis TaxID=2692265 RepID=A0ABW9YW75_9HYPH|nr:hypothetical protein [Microvirga arsenatis]NBJ23121.1 hypothetical protein [Microvirga arsenatis]